MKMTFSQFATKGSICAILLGTAISAYAQDAKQNITYFDGHENRSISVKMENYTPNHPECTAKPAPLPIEVPVVAAAVSAPVIIPAPAVIPSKPVIEADSDGDGVVDSLDECPGTPKGYKVDTKGCPSSVTLHLNFKTGSSVLPKSSEKDVHTLTEFLQENPAATITIIGHTDNVGKAAKNMTLSKARADALATRIVENGIETGRIKTSGKGLSEPIASNKTKLGRAQNRRINVEIR